MKLRIYVIKQLISHIVKLHFQFRLLKYDNFVFFKLVFCYISELCVKTPLIAQVNDLKDTYSLGVRWVFMTPIFNRLKFSPCVLWCLGCMKMVSVTSEYGSITLETTHLHSNRMDQLNSLQRHQNIHNFLQISQKSTKMVSL